jgi:modification methylase
MELNKIYNEDCLEFMNADGMEGVFDMIVTSPPYNFGGFDRNGRKSGYDTYSDDMPDEDYRKWIGRVLEGCARVLKPGGALYWNHKGKFQDHEYKAPFWVVDVCPLTFYQHIVWKYPSSPDVAKVKWYPRHEEIFMFTKGIPAYFNEEMAQLGDVWDISHMAKNEHPAPFPLRLAKRAIAASCPPDGIVYDPFMGSGTTALAAIENKVSFVGTEISQRYVNYANSRIGIIQAEPTLF